MGTIEDPCTLVPGRGQRDLQVRDHEVGGGDFPGALHSSCSRTHHGSSMTEMSLVSPLATFTAISETSF